MRCVFWGANLTNFSTLFSHFLLHHHTPQSCNFLPHWIRHHAPIFDQVLMVDLGTCGYFSHGEAPSSWLYKSSAEFEGTLEGDIIRQAEIFAPSGAWQITLESTDFLVHGNLREALNDIAGNSTKGLMPQSLALLHLQMLCNNTALPRHFSSPLLRCTKYLLNKNHLSGGNSVSRGHFFRSRSALSDVGVNYALFLNKGFTAVFAKNIDPLTQSHDLFDIFERSFLDDGEHVLPAVRNAHTAWYEVFSQDLALF